METRRYANAPITEAIIDLQVEHAGEVPLSIFETIANSHRESYPNRRNFGVTHGRIEIGPEIATSARSEQIGFVLISPDEKQVVRVHRGGFVFSRLAPYQGWEAFRTEARRLWSSYRDVVTPERITRIALRFVNRLDLPGPRLELKDYLTVGPDPGPLLTESLTGFFLQLQLPQSDWQAMAILNEMLVESGRPDCISIVLDIDLFRIHALPTNEDELWSVFERLRICKNRLFEASITERTRELIR